MNLTLLKSLKFWIAVLVAIVGVGLTQGVVVEGSTPAVIIGWIMTLLGGAGTGHAAATNSAETV